MVRARLGPGLRIASGPGLCAGPAPMGGGGGGWTWSRHTPAMGNCFLGHAKENLPPGSVQAEAFPKHPYFGGVGLALCSAAGLLQHHHSTMAWRPFVFRDSFPGGCVRKGWRDGQGGEPEESVDGRVVLASAPCRVSCTLTGIL